MRIQHVYEVCVLARHLSAQINAISLQPSYGKNWWRGSKSQDPDQQPRGQSNPDDHRQQPQTLVARAPSVATSSSSATSYSTWSSQNIRQENARNSRQTTSKTAGLGVGALHELADNICQLLNSPRDLGNQVRLATQRTRTSDFEAEWTVAGLAQECVFQPVQAVPYLEG
ncbi:unnamed protein product [Protopolystoma xenopodis]|uniref:Uncharacterized protein n=1 Tax=Protopolystoma xenopodis TaxID=117903 RepID=A0A3S5AUF6_9PLAT|nr:unnamed protein product [Protopolystoma xenopodis]